MTDKTKVVTVNRLSEAVYNDFVKTLRQSNIAVTNETSPLHAGFQLGVQHVLNELRRGVVVTA